MVNMAIQAEMALGAARNGAVRTRLPQGKDESAFAKLLASDPLQDTKLKESCRQMEGLLVKQMLTVMRKSIAKSGFIDGGHAEEIFTDMLYDQYADKMSRSADFGLAKAIYSQLTAGKKWI